MKLRVFVVTIAIAGPFWSCLEEGDFELRRKEAKKLLSGKCEFVVNASTEFIREKHPIGGAILGRVISNRCGCVADSLAVQFANEFSLSELKDMEKQPLESLSEVIKKLMNKNSGLLKIVF